MKYVSLDNLSTPRCSALVNIMSNNRTIILIILTLASNSQPQKDNQTNVFFGDGVIDFLTRSSLTNIIYFENQHLMALN